MYQGAHGVLVLYDVTARATWEHAKALAAAAPPTLPVLLLGNMRDAAPPSPSPSVVALAELNAFVESANASSSSGGGKKGSAAAAAAALVAGRRFFGFEVSTRECFGLKTLYN